MDHHLVLMVHLRHQNQYNQQLKEIFGIQQQTMLWVLVFVLDMSLLEYLDHDIDR
jgi:hypothetical protein